MSDYRAAALGEADRAMLDFAIKLTRAPAEMSESDVIRLRDHGFDDVAIHDITQVTALFAYYNRLADGLGIEDEADW
jgi:uncharacterized peroxidase-related enzyme